ncbi:BamA/OMP85 family outer membrane protein [Planctomicrobium sp. SH664]|uniref:BamA/OMP85 family outer membrane protein n=1 Tax=Planctomicrobium sp. SH664 TaxID=3448125 RepID=UPI003F5AFAE5
MKSVAQDTRRPCLPRRIVQILAAGACLMVMNLQPARAQAPFPRLDATDTKPGVEERKAFAPRPETLGSSRTIGDAPHSLSGINPTDGVKPASFSAEKLVDEPLADVLIEGQKTIPLNAIMRYVETRPGRAASPRQVQQDVSRLLNTNWFLSVRPSYRATDEGPVLVFQVLERPILKSVEFRGNKKIKTGELSAHTGLKAGHGYDVAINRESVNRIKNLYREKGYLFAEVTLEKGGSPDDREVIFNIVEGPKPKIWDISFEGNSSQSFTTSAVLKTKLSSNTVILWLIRGDYDPVIIKNDVQALKEYYMNLGYFSVQVRAEERLSEDRSKVYVTFTIDEGKRSKVGEIDVIGNDVISKSELLKELKLKQGDYFNERWLREDVNGMKDKYDDLGRLKATVTPTPRFRPDDDGVVDLVYEINEDMPRYIGTINIHVRGDYPHSQEDTVRKQVDRYLKPGTLARGRDLRMAQSRVNGSGIWDREDPPVFDLKPNDGLDYIPRVAARGQSVIQDEFIQTSSVQIQETTRPPTGHSLAPADAVSARPAAGAGIHGTSVQQPPVVVPKTRSNSTESLFISPDDVFRGQSPDFRGQTLDGYGNPAPQDFYFGVSPQGDPYGDVRSVPQPPGFMDLDIEVSEGRTGRLMFGVGVNSDAGVIGQITLQEDNFDILRPPTSFADIINGTAWRGAGQSFRLEAQPGDQVSRYLASWQDPYFMRTDFSLGVSGFYFNRYYESWTEDRLGGRISLGYVLDRYWSIGTALRLESVNIRNVPTIAPPQLVDVKGENFLSTASATLQYDTRDNAFFPTRGHMATASYEQAFGEFTYPRFDVGLSQYFTTYERPDGFGKHVLSLSGELGWTGNDTPIFENFFAGGYSSFRGFAFRGVGPVDMGVRVGGTFLALGTVEYMIPITANDNIRTVVFSDFGTVEPDVTLDQFRVTAGFGFRLQIPAMGAAPLAFDFAWPVLDQPEDDRRVFSFYVGFTR